MKNLLVFLPLASANVIACNFYAPAGSERWLFLNSLRFERKVVIPT